MVSVNGRWKKVYISQGCHERLRRLVDSIKPKPKIGSLVEYLIDQECLKQKVIDEKAG